MWCEIGIHFLGDDQRGKAWWCDGLTGGIAEEGGSGIRGGSERGGGKRVRTAAESEGFFRCAVAGRCGPDERHRRADEMRFRKAKNGAGGERQA